MQFFLTIRAGELVEGANCEQGLIRGLATTRATDLAANSSIFNLNLNLVFKIEITLFFFYQIHLFAILGQYKNT